MSRFEPELTPNALQVLRARYLNTDAEARVSETPGDMFWRVATHVAAVEEHYGGNPSASADAFYDAMARLQFLPNSPALMNAGTSVGQLAACFVLPIEDSLDRIFRYAPRCCAHSSNRRRRGVRLHASSACRRPRDIDGRRVERSPLVHEGV